MDFEDKTLWSLEEYIGDFKPEIIHVEDPARIYGLALFGLGVAMAYNDVIGLDYARANNIPALQTSAEKSLYRGRLSVGRD